MNEENGLLLSHGQAEFASEPAPEQPLTIEQAIANLSGPDYGSRYYAAWWLGRFRVRSPEAVAALIATLNDESDRTPDGGYPLRRNSARALAKLGDPQAVPALLTCLSCTDYYVRETAAQALGILGDQSCIEPLAALLAGGLAAAQPIPGSPHLAQPYDAVLEALGALGAIAKRPLIEPFLEHPTELVQYAAARALYQLTQDEGYGDRLIAALSGEKLQLRRAALADLGAIGYLKAAEPISLTLAENSLKLIALKGVLEHHLTAIAGSIERGQLTDEARQVMELMDGLL
ncbi:MAG: HEAT repeat domain-containing protein [Thermosynechococcaceae cyanobacterium MS004]|nr:HEAT repeat domain-containing protein [Thermosynechococcaceae cyanobacterium MS004]